MAEGSPPAPDIERLEHFAASVAHDFNNLLTGILGNLELMQNRAARLGVTQFDGYLDGARNAGMRAATFSQRLLAFSGRAAQDSSAVDLYAVLHDAMETLGARGVRAHAAPPAEQPVLVCDAAHAELTLHELLSNAADAVAQGGDVYVYLECQADRISLTIRDTGAGMTPEILARATEPFFSTRPNGAGKGLGLAIAERFARQTGGTLTLASEFGAGTTVCLTLPR